MRIRTAFLLIAIFVAAMIVQLFMTAGVSLWWKTGIASALAICLLLLYISVVRPMTTLANGIDLLKGQAAAWQRWGIRMPTGWWKCSIQ